MNQGDVTILLILTGLTLWATDLHRPLRGDFMIVRAWTCRHCGNSETSAICKACGHWYRVTPIARLYWQGEGK